MNDVLLFVGAAAVLYGLYLIFPPAAIIAFGLMCAALAWSLSAHEGGDE